MSWENVRKARQRLAGERGTIGKDWGGRVPVVLAYPNSYYLGMSNLGFQTVYGLLNACPNVVCERAFFESRLDGTDGDVRGAWNAPEGNAGRGAAAARRLERIDEAITIESQRPIAEAAVLAFSISYEMDYFNVPALLAQAGIPLWTDERDERHPLVLAGGPAVMANPEPLAPFFDVLVNGEAEAVLPRMVPLLEVGLPGPRATLLRTLAEVPGAYVPALHGSVGFADRQTGGQSWPIPRQAVPDISSFATTSVVLTEQTELSDLYLLEVCRGCVRGCRFCLAGYIFRPMRYRPLELLLAQAREGLKHKPRIGLVGPAATDYPHIDELVTGIRKLGGGVGLSSIRMERISHAIVQSVLESGTRTITLAPETGTERLRKDVAKRMSDEKILRAVDLVAGYGIQRLKLYFMIGLPTETDDDARAIVSLVTEIKRRLDARNPGTQVVVNCGPFVPKAQTPFQWVPMASVALLKHRVAIVQSGLRAKGIAVRSDSPEWAAVQAVLARGDRKVARALAAMDRLSLAAWNRACRRAEVDPAEYIYRAIDPAEPLPWDVMDAGLKPGFLERELAQTEENALRNGSIEPLSRWEWTGVRAVPDQDLTLGKNPWVR